LFALHETHKRTFSVAFIMVLNKAYRTLICLNLKLCLNGPYILISLELENVYNTNFFHPTKIKYPPFLLKCSLSLFHFEFQVAVRIRPLPAGETERCLHQLDREVSLLKKQLDNGPSRWIQSKF
jgi:hypothetical protein